MSILNKRTKLNNAIHFALLLLLAFSEKESVEAWSGECICKAVTSIPSSCPFRYRFFDNNLNDVNVCYNDIFNPSPKPMELQSKEDGLYLSKNVFSSSSSKTKTQTDSTLRSTSSQTSTKTTTSSVGNSTVLDEGVMAVGIYTANCDCYEIPYDPELCSFVSELQVSYDGMTEQLVVCNMQV